MTLKAGDQGLPFAPRALRPRLSGVGHHGGPGERGSCVVEPPDIRQGGGRGRGRLRVVRLPARRDQAGAGPDGGAGVLSGSDIPKFQTPMLIPPVMPRAGTFTQRGGKPADYYEISVRQLEQQILPPELPPTTVWGYGAVRAASRRGLLVHNAPSLTIEATHDRPVRVRWINDLVDAGGGYLPHLLPVDPTLHWANPPGGTSGRDTRPRFDETPGPYRGPGSARHPRPRSRRGRRRERRVSRGVVPAGGERHPERLRRRRHLVRLLRRARPPLPKASPGDVATRPSSTRTPTGRRPTGTTTTRWG